MSKTTRQPPISGEKPASPKSAVPAPLILVRDPFAGSVRWGLSGLAALKSELRR